MHFTEQQPEHLNIESLVEDLTGLTSSELAALKPGSDGQQGSPLAGLHFLLRRAIEIAIVLSGRQKAAVRLKTEEGARAHGWPCAKAANLAVLLAWSLMQARRRAAGLPFAQLELAGTLVGDPPERPDERLQALPTAALIEAFAEPVRGEKQALDEPSPTEETYPVDPGTLIRSMLRLEPSTLHLYRTDAEVMACAPEVNARIGLGLLAHDVLSQYAVMRARRTTAIRLLGDADAKDAKLPSVRAGRLATLLAAALHSDLEHEVFFVAARERTEEERARLRETAKFVYRDYCDEALSGFELVCDGIVHFGHGVGWTIAERLLADDEVIRECDPDLTRMPHCVAMQTAINAMAAIG